MNPAVRSREHLLHLLAEAAELEHNLLCSYLYAAFSLKRDAAEDVLDHELAAIRRWHAAIMAVCTEEMTHLAQIANLMVAVGARPHFDRPNLPVAPGYHPARIQVALAPFDLDTLEHFIFLERPDTSAVEDAPPLPPEGDRPPRRPEAGALMPSAPDYDTIGEFYGLLGDGLASLARRLGEQHLFIGPADYQLRADELRLPELSVVTDLASAQRALRLIVVQGEGSPGNDDGDGGASHFGQFLAIRREYRELLERRPAFRPARPVARNPVMRLPQADDRVHVTGRAAAPLLDAANAVYSLLLRCLVEVYDTPWAKAARREALLGAALGLMQALGELSAVLTTLPASDDGDGARVNAGVTFAMVRATEGLAPTVDALAVLRQRFDDVLRRLPQLDLPDAAARRLHDLLRRLADSLHDA